jgi:hypothetical protein
MHMKQTNEVREIEVDPITNGSTIHAEATVYICVASPLSREMENYSTGTIEMHLAESM